ncbi:killer toxin [Mycena sp. CBHHK59/15]|nr:killer toxin [Mycena sp. CBHHK59/15]
MFSIPVALLTTAIGTPACTGAALCISQPSNSTALLAEYISGINPARVYAAGEQIACSANVCAFVENVHSALRSQIASVAHYIPQHGCAKCGTVPLFYPDDMNFC